MSEGRQEVKDQICLALSQKPPAILVQINLCRLDGIGQEVKESQPGGKGPDLPSNQPEAP